MLGTTMSEVAYILGHAEAEMRRLMLQAELLKPITERLLREAGIKPGMRILDLGSGAGDVAMLAATLVGPSGAVVGIDRSADAIKAARERASIGGHDNIRFHEGDIEDFIDPLPFDLAIGRYVLIHQADPGAFIGSVAAHIQPGGSIAFHEPSISRFDKIFPSVELQQKCLDWIYAALASAGATLDTAENMGRYFDVADLEQPNLFCEILVGSDWKSPILAWLSSTVRTMLPQIEMIGAATDQQIEIETLEHRLREAVRIANLQVVGPPQMCGWVRR
jgi:ubiquinone/menaquinone biosynthesis C-methylase UbiE